MHQFACRIEELGISSQILTAHPRTKFFCTIVKSWFKSAEITASIKVISDVKYQEQKNVWNTIWYNRILIESCLDEVFDGIRVYQKSGGKEKIPVAKIHLYYIIIISRIYWVIACWKWLMSHSVNNSKASCVKSRCKTFYFNSSVLYCTPTNVIPAFQNCKSLFLVKRLASTPMGIYPTFRSDVSTLLYS